MKYLVEDYRVIRFDLRRHGLTGPALDNQYEIESYVSDLSLVIEHLGINSCDLVGHSHGGVELLLNLRWKTLTEFAI